MPEMCEVYGQCYIVTTPSLGIDFKLKTFTVQEKRIRLQIWYVYDLCSLVFSLRLW